MEILWWLAPPAGVTLAAMVWVAWLGRPQREDQDRSEAAYDRFSAAISREHPAATKQRVAPVRDRSTGIAVRPSRGQAHQQTRRSA